MKFLHIGDLHLGRALGNFDLIEDQKYILDQILDIAKKCEADAVLVAGDVYDKSVPSEAAVRLFDYFIRRLAEDGLQAFIISGNHDSDERMNFGSSLFRTNGIYISAKYEGELLHLRVRKEGKRLKVLCVEGKTEVMPEKGKMSETEETSDEESLDIRKKESMANGTEDEIHIYLMPFLKASQVRHYFPEEKIENYEDAVRTVLKAAEVDPAQKNVLVAHQFVAESGKNSADPVLGGSEGIATQHVGLVEKIGADCFDAFDYVALGHIHSPQAVGRPEVRYSGSPLKYSLSEANHVKSVPVVTLENKGEVQVDLVPLHPLRDLRHIRGRRAQLLAQENITAPEDFIYVTLTDEDVIDDAMAIFQQYYPNTVRIEYDNSHTKGLQTPEDADITPDVPFDELIAGFYRQMYGCDMSEDERRLMREAAREAGIEIGEDESLTENERNELSTGKENHKILTETGTDKFPTENGEGTSTFEEKVHVGNSGKAGEVE